MNHPSVSISGENRHKTTPLEDLAKKMLSLVPDCLDTLDTCHSQKESFQRLIEAIPRQYSTNFDAFIQACFVEEDEMEEEIEIFLSSHPEIHQLLTSMTHNLPQDQQRILTQRLMDHEGYLLMSQKFAKAGISRARLNTDEILDILSKNPQGSLARNEYESLSCEDMEMSQFTQEEIVKIIQAFPKIKMIKIIFFDSVRLHWNTLVQQIMGIKMLDVGTSFLSDCQVRGDYNILIELLSKTKGARFGRENLGLLDDNGFARFLTATKQLRVLSLVENYLTTWERSRIEAFCANYPNLVALQLRFCQIQHLSLENLRIFASILKPLSMLSITWDTFETLDEERAKILMEASPGLTHIEFFGHPILKISDSIKVYQTLERFSARPLIFKPNIPNFIPGK